MQLAQLRQWAAPSVALWQSGRRHRYSRFMFRRRSYFQQLADEVEGTCSCYKNLGIASRSNDVLGGKVDQSVVTCTAGEHAAVAFGAALDDHFFITPNSCLVAVKT